MAGEGVFDNPRSERVKKVAHLATRAGRKKTGRFLVEGPHAVHLAVASGAAREVYISEETQSKEPQLADLLASENEARARVIVCSHEVVAVMADATTPQGVVAVCDSPLLTPEQAVSKISTFAIALVGVGDPGNVGTVIRAADAAGASAVFLTKGCADVLSPKCVRSTAGSLFHVPVCAGIEPEDLTGLWRDADVQSIATSGYATDDLFSIQDEADVLTRKHGWLIGSEGQGLPQHLLESSDRQCVIPLLGAAESLNAAMAATVCLYSSAAAQRRRNP